VQHDHRHQFRGRHRLAFLLYVKHFSLINRDNDWCGRSHPHLYLIFLPEYLYRNGVVQIFNASTT
jgi:hypothetical protein